MKMAFCLALALATAPVVQAWGDDCAAEATREADVDAQGAQSLRVLARAGSLKIVGEAGRTRVSVRGHACASDQETLEAIRLRAERKGEELRVEADVPNGWSGLGSFYARLDLELLVPAALAADVEDSSGALEIRNVASLRLKDSSGAILVEDVPGEVRIRDGSGEIEVAHVGSLVVDDDGSGAITARDVRQDVRIREDGSGGIEIREVGGSVYVDDDGSGGIRVSDVAGDFRVGSKGSGSVRHSGVKGRVDVPER